MPTRSTSERSDATSTGGACLLLVCPDQPAELRTAQGHCGRWRSDVNAAQSSSLSVDGDQATGLTAENGIAPLFVARKGDRTAVGSDPIRPALALGLPLAANDHFFANHFSLRRVPTTGSPIEHVDVVAPGTRLRIDRAGVDRTRASPDRPRSLSRATFDEHVATCREKLDAAILAAIAEDSEPCIQLSGGIDSLLLLKRLRALGRAPRAVSWSLHRFEQADEGAQIRRRCREEAVPWQLVDLSHRWPGREVERHQDALWPVHNAYAGLIEAMRGLAADSGGSTLLNGDGADSLLDAERYRLVDALRLADPKVIWDEAISAIRWKPWEQPRLRALAQVFGRHPKPMIGRWLTDAAADATRQHGHSLVHWPHPEQARGACNLSGLPPWSAHESKDAIRVALPYRDPELIATMLRMPAHHLIHRNGQKRLPHAIAGTSTGQFAARTGLLNVFFDHGIFDKESAHIRSILFHGGECWPRFVRRPFIEQVLRSPHAHRPIEKLVLWLCVCFELWLARIGEPDQGLNWR